jgi:predicted RND superfamily exporter protein
LGDNDNDLEQGGADRVVGTTVVDQGQDADDDKSNFPLKDLSCLVLIGIVLATATAIKSLLNCLSNFEWTSARTTSEKKKSEWTEAYKMKWHDSKEQERYQAASQVHAIVFAQLGALSH